MFKELHKKTLRLIVAAALLTPHFGCVRFIPSRADLNKPYKDDPSIEYVGLDAFYLYEREQRSRLEKLIRDRTKKSLKQWEDSYRVGPGDRLQIEVKNFEEVNKSYTVQPNGQINLPFVGRVSVQGKTEDEIIALVADRVKDYVLEPQAHVEVVEYTAHKVWVIGGAGHDFSSSRGAMSSSDSRSSPHAFPLRKPNYSLVELLVEIGEGRLLTSMGTIYLYPGGLYGEASKLGAENIELRDVGPFCENRPNGWAARDKSKSSDSGKVPEEDYRRCGAYDSRLARTELEQKYHPNSKIQIDVEELFGGISKPPLHVPLRPGDAIYIPTSALVQVYGEANNRGSFSVVSYGGSGQSAAGIKPTLMSVVAAADGLTYAADIHNIEIYRELEFGRKVVLNVDFEELTLRGTQDVRLRDGDIVWIPSQSGRFTEQHSINAINSLLGAGNSVYNTATQE